MKCNKMLVNRNISCSFLYSDRCNCVIGNRVTFYMTMNYRLTQNSQFTTNFLQDKVTVMTDYMIPAEEIELEISNFRTFQISVTVTLNQVIRHSII